MEFALSEEQEAIFDLAYSFGQENIAPFSITGRNKELSQKSYGQKPLNLALAGSMSLRSMADQA
tara:strand:+ start:229 stop:420 length:192 start_codon:yes stop_codon:yes gene_type:complete